RNLPHLMRGEEDVEHAAQLLRLLPERVASGIVEPNDVAIVNGAQPQTYQPVVLYQPLEPSGILLVGGRIETVAYQESNRGKLARICLDAVARIRIVASVIADMRDHYVIHPPGLHLGKQVFGGVIILRKVFRADGQLRIDWKARIAQDPGVLSTVHY